MSSTLAERFRKMRQLHNKVTQDELASLMGVKRSRIADIERGKVRELKADEVVKLQEQLQVDGWWLMTGEGSAVTEQHHATPAAITDIPVQEKVTESTEEPASHRFSPSKPSIGNESEYFVENNRFEPLVPQGSTLYLESTSDLKDGNYLLIEHRHGVYIKRYQIDIGDETGMLLIKSVPEKRASLAELKADGGRVLGVIRGFHKEL